MIKFSLPKLKGPSCWSSRCGAMGRAASWEHGDSGSVPFPAQRVKDRVLQGSDPWPGSSVCHGADKRKGKKGTSCSGLNACVPLLEFRCRSPHPEVTVSGHLGEDWGPQEWHCCPHKKDPQRTPRPDSQPRHAGSSHTCKRHHRLQQRRILNPLSKARDRTCILLVTSLVLNLLGHNGNALSFQK